MRTRPKPSYEIGTTPVWASHPWLKKFVGEALTFQQGPRVVKSEDIPRSELMAFLLEKGIRVLSRYFGDFYHDCMQLSHFTDVAAWRDGYFYRVTDSNTWWAPKSPKKGDLRIEHLIQEYPAEALLFFVRVEDCRRDDMDARLVVYPVQVTMA